MTLIKIDMIKGRTEEEIRSILAISHHVMLDAFDASEGDR